MAFARGRSAADIDGAGYATGAAARSFGMALTCYPTVAGLIVLATAVLGRLCR